MVTYIKSIKIEAVTGRVELIGYFRELDIGGSPV